MSCPFAPSILVGNDDDNSNSNNDESNNDDDNTGENDSSNHNIHTGVGCGCKVDTSLGISRFPVTENDVDKVEDALEREFNALSINEREKVLFDIHGISQFVDEYDPSNINDLLREVGQELDKIQKKEAYDLAMTMNADYVTARDFRLMFLRSERYDPKGSAERMVEHFESKRYLFGSAEVLGRDILLSDLNDDDRAALEVGHVQVLPRRDAAGRVVIFIAPQKKEYRCVPNLTRCMMYTMMKILQEEETQKKGLVVVVHNTGKIVFREEFQLMRQVNRTRYAIPDKLVGGHYCYSDPILRPFIAGMKLLMQKDERTRFRTHFGTDKEILFQLQTYGIDTSTFPLREDGTLSVSWHREWIRIQKGKEEYGISVSTATNDDVIPRRFDVLFGRSRTIRQHTGNLRAGHLVEMYKEQYERANKYEKTEIAERLVSIIHESNGRFLKWDKQIGWVQVDNDVAREKVSHFFRHNRSKNNEHESQKKDEADKEESTTSNGNKTTAKKRRNVQSTVRDDAAAAAAAATGATTAGTTTGDSAIGSLRRLSSSSSSSGQSNGSSTNNHPAKRSAIQQPDQETAQPDLSWTG